MARQRAEQTRVMFKFLARKRNVPLPQRGQTGSINQLPPYSLGKAGLFPGVKVACA